MSSLALGLGVRPGVEPAAVRDAVAAVLGALPPARVVAVGTLDGRADEPAVRAVAALLGAPVRGVPAAALAPLAGTGSARVARAVGTPAVAEPAALLVAQEHAGRASSLVVARRVVGGVVLAVADAGDGDPGDPPGWPWSPPVHVPGSTVPGATAGRDGLPGGRVNTT